MIRQLLSTIITLGLAVFPLTAQPSPAAPFPLPNGVVVKTIAEVTSTCILKPGDFLQTCTINNSDPSFLGLPIGNLADARGFMYGTTPVIDPQTSKPADRQQLFATSPDGVSRVISTITANRTCAASGQQATLTSRGVFVAGYNLGAQALYIGLTDTTETEAFTPPQNGITIGCSSAGGFQISLLPPGMTSLPPMTTTTTYKTTYFKLTGKLGFDGNGRD